MNKKSENRVKCFLSNISHMSLFEKICMVVLILQIGFIAYTNFFMIPNTLDNDSAKLFLHAEEIWRNKKIFLPNWENMTTLKIDCSALLAIPFWAIFKNIYAAFALSNIIFILIYIYVFYILLVRLSVSRAARIVSYIFLLIPFSFGQLLYYNMMFFSGGQYVVKVLVPLLYIIVLTSDEIKLKEIIIGAFSIILTLVMGVSSGPYILVTGVVPIILAYFICDLIKKDHLRNVICIKSVYLILIGFTALLGEFVCLKKHVNTSGNSTRLVGGNEIIESLLKKVGAYFEIIGGYPYERTNILSFEGLVMSFKCLMAVIILVLLILAVADAIKDKNRSKTKVYICT